MNPRINFLLNTILYFYIFLSTGCDVEESSYVDDDLNKISCSDFYSLPPKHHCLSFENQTAPAFYGLNSLIGTWSLRSGDFCITYHSDGSGEIRYSGKGFTNTGFSPSSNYTNIHWGVLVNEDGSFVRSTSGHQYVLHENLGPGEVDTQIILLAFDEKKREFHGWDLIYGDCKTSTNTNTNNEPIPGRVMFWSKKTQYGYISVKVNNVVKPVYFYGAQPKNCDNFATAYKLDAGTYNFIAAATYGNARWEGTVTIEENTCLLFELN